MADKRDLPPILDGKFFSVASRDKNGKVTADCKFCAPNKDGQANKITGSLQVTSNFTTHLKRRHPEKSKEYQDYLKDCHNPKQKRLDFPKTVVSNAQTRTDQLIINYIVESMSPLSTVEMPAFKKLIKGLRPDINVLTRSTLGSRMDERFELSKSDLRARMNQAQYVCATADIWSGKRRSFLGVTCHWIDDDLDRQSAVLSIRRFKGSHTYDRIADLLLSIFSMFGLSHEKIVCVVTDNGSNFVKAFKEYGIQVDQVQDQDEDPDVPEVQDASEILSEAEEIILPQHQRCASHTLSLVATKDAEKAKIVKQQPGMEPYKKTFTSTMAKCAALWNKSSHSPKVAEKIQEICQKCLIFPVPTRWNSLFDSIKRLLELKDQLNTICNVSTVPMFKPVEIQFLEDYVVAMYPVAIGLDKLQSDKNFHFGYLFPTIVQIKKKLEDVISNENNRHFTVPLAEALKAGVEERFPGMCNLDIENCREHALAAISHPFFKLRWLPKSHQERGTKLFLAEAKRFCANVQPPKANIEATAQNITDNFFEFNSGAPDRNPNLQSSLQSSELECYKYLNDNSIDLKSLDQYSCIKHMFLRFNTALPSSAPAERLFSYAGLILSPNRGRLSDDMFEKLVFLKTNANI